MHVHMHLYSDFFTRELSFSSLVRFFFSQDLGFRVYGLHVDMVLVV